MTFEIERKFLVISDAYKQEAHQKNYIKQGFLNSQKERVVRIRIKDDSGFLTIKGASNKSGTTRFEWEKEIPLQEAQNLLKLCEKGSIEKYRYLVKSNNHTYEIDDFLGDNKGLVVAEIELSEENEAFEKPDWLGKEVTGIVKYYNSNLSKMPFCNW
ncbi:CYTH domain-containing protein [Tenacibaculum piscium]|uniref:CYTH domain-containing protein n=1 Tax=Tenacibaculum piscium TaxID=1458515 RepID=UPI001EFA4769|nr:CYTH domain-containing protein [Tenacibaculum piscium]MCG8183332.1 CYTH domain-containing protein [Tenacibaculum piscium]MCG8204484.1 CYTH domain-containing protein [Tenacibaculum piscium]